jgi:hypothetical protein
MAELNVESLRQIMERVQSERAITEIWVNQDTYNRNHDALMRMQQESVVGGMRTLFIMIDNDLPDGRAKYK